MTTLTPYMLRRVHISSDAHMLNAAILEYRAFAEKFPADDLTPLLLDVANDCEEELRVREERA